MDNVYEYGNEDTWHASKVLDIEVDSKGNVVAVWFRCQMLPFKVSIVDDMRASELAFHVNDLALELHSVKLKVIDNGQES